MTKIVHIIDELKIGGAQTHLVTMLRHLKSSYPFEHQVISLFGDGEIGNQIRTLGIPVIALDLRHFLASKRFDLALSTIRKHIITFAPDLVEAHLTWSRLLGLLAAQITGVRTRVGFEQGDTYMNSLKFRIANYMSQIYTGQYIVCSEALSTWVQKTHHIRRKNISVFHNCVDTSRFHPSVSPAEDILKAKGTSIAFVMVGTLGKGVNKRVDIGIKAFAALQKQNIEGSLFITGDGALRPELEQLTSELNVAHAVHFLGMRDDIPAILAACDIFLHAAPFEPFGIVVLEAMAVGCPVIIPDRGGISEIIKDKRNGLIYPTLDSMALTERMIQLSTNPKYYQQIQQAAFHTIHSQFTVERYIKRLYTLYGLLPL